MYFPIEGSNNHGLLWVNHEYSSDVFVQGAPAGLDGKYTAKQIEQMLYEQGGSIIEVVGDKKGGWKMDTTSNICTPCFWFDSIRINRTCKRISSSWWC